MAEESAEYRAQLMTLMRIALILDTAGEGVLGKGAPAMMYQAGRDAGCSQGCAPGETADMEQALRMVLTEGDEVWEFERWNDPRQESPWIDGGDRSSTWMLFRRCPLLTLSRKAGSIPGGLLCQALHGYMAGSMERVLGRRVDMKVDHCGPRACKVLVELRA